MDATLVNRTAINKNSRTCQIMETLKKVQEIKIPVPWGYVAGKSWGEEYNPLVFCIHGLMDNAGTFDLLLTLLPNSFYYVAIDLPGHGQSSPFPPHLPIHTLNNLLVYKHASKHFGKRFIIMGHSYGGQLGFLYAQLYPDCVEKIVMLDSITLIPIPTEFFKDYLGEYFDDFVNQEERQSKKVVPSYTREQALDKLQHSRRHSVITKEAAEALLTRSITQVENGLYRFTLDRRMKHPLNPTRDIRYDIETMKSNPVSCPVLIILGKESTVQQMYLSEVIGVLKNWKNVSFKMVEGNHDVHNNNPERVAPHVAKFLLSRKSKL